MHKLFLTLFALFIFNAATAQWTLDLEGGAARFGYNDVRIPGNSGTLFSLSDDFDKSFTPFYRLRLQYTIGERHAISALYAPFAVKSKGISASTIFFQDVLFKEDDPIHSTWKFNSYRLSYQYNLIAKDKFIFGIGITGKIRDAKIELKNSTVSATKTNIGFVPLIRFYADLTIAEKLHLILDGDALVAKQGRAEDVLFAIGYNPLQRLRLKLGYRILEGGADNEEVYDFSSVHYLSAGISYTF